jgi:hypothetical protein
LQYVDPKMRPNRTRNGAISFNVTARLVAGAGLALLAALAGCLLKWELPTQTATRAYSYGKEDGRELRIPENLLATPPLDAMARDCARAANKYVCSAADNHFWSVVFGVTQVAGATIGTASGSAAFVAEKPNVASRAAKLSAVSFAVAAGIAALDRAARPGSKADHQARLALRNGALILLAASQLAENQPGEARATLIQCLDPSDVRDGDLGVGEVDIEGLQNRTLRLMEEAERGRNRRDAGTVDGGDASQTDT